MRYVFVDDKMTWKEMKRKIRKNKSSREWKIQPEANDIMPAQRENFPVNHDDVMIQRAGWLTKETDGNWEEKDIKKFS